MTMDGFGLFSTEQASNKMKSKVKLCATACLQAVLLEVP
jgi:hypothetical protein